MVTPLAVVDQNATQISGTLTVLGRVKSGEERARLARVSAAARVALNATRSHSGGGSASAALAEGALAAIETIANSLDTLAAAAPSWGCPRRSSSCRSSRRSSTQPRACASPRIATGGGGGEHSSGARRAPAAAGQGAHRRARAQNTHTTAERRRRWGLGRTLAQLLRSLGTYHGRGGAGQGGARAARQRSPLARQQR